ncbi:MAG: 2-oxoacid:acceptor oxidoreductase family protein [Bacillota bacterium]|jgi:2-oxoglutarate ferredoxin oxidoreductase subunit gamma
MRLAVIMAGFGGQGVMSMGQLLAYAGMFEGKEVTWLPSYGPEMRGGTANCTVIVSDEPVASPVETKPDACIIMNRPSLDRFEGAVVPGGLLVINTSLCDKPASRGDLRVVALPATDLAAELGDVRVANMVALGAFLAVEPVVQAASVVDALKKALPAHRQNLIPLNERALALGAETARAQLTA